MELKDKVTILMSLTIYIYFWGVFFLGGGGGGGGGLCLMGG